MASACVRAFIEERGATHVAMSAVYPKWLPGEILCEWEAFENSDRWSLACFLSLFLNSSLTNDNPRSTPEHTAVAPPVDDGRGVIRLAQWPPASVQQLFDDSWREGFGDGSHFSGRLVGKSGEEAQTGPLDWAEVLLHRSIEVHTVDVHDAPNAPEAARAELLAALLVASRRRGDLVVYQPHNNASAKLVVGSAVVAGQYWLLLDAPRPGWRSVGELEWVEAESHVAALPFPVQVLMLSQTDPGEAASRSATLRVANTRQEVVQLRRQGCSTAGAVEGFIAWASWNSLYSSTGSMRWTHWTQAGGELAAAIRAEPVTHEELPTPWSKWRIVKGGRLRSYYYNSATKQSQWASPVIPAPAAPTHAPEPAALAPAVPAPAAVVATRVDGLPSEPFSAFADDEPAGGADSASSGSLPGTALSEEQLLLTMTHLMQLQRSGQTMQAAWLLEAANKLGVSIDLGAGRWGTSDGRTGTTEPFAVDVLQSQPPPPSDPPPSDPPQTRAKQILGWTIGERCVLLTTHPPCKLVRGDEGTVVGPCTNKEVADAAIRVTVDFGQDKGCVHVVAASQIETQKQWAARLDRMRQLGWAVGDRCVSLVTDALCKLVRGDEGTVIGPCTNKDAEDAAMRVLVDFGKGKEAIDVIAATQIETQKQWAARLDRMRQLGWAVGDRCVCLVNDSKGRFMAGDGGTIVGPTKSNFGSEGLMESAFVSVSVHNRGHGPIETIEMNAKLEITTQVEWASRVESVRKLGWTIGDRCVLLNTHLSCKPVRGDEGTVVGPCTKDVADAAIRVTVDFGQGKGCAHVVAASQIETQKQWAARLDRMRQLGWAVGDRCVSLVDDPKEALKAGYEGTIVGPPHSADRSWNPSNYVSVAFDHRPDAPIDLHVKGEIATKEQWARRVEALRKLGWAVGDICVSLVDRNGIRLGTQGTIVHPRRPCELNRDLGCACADFGLLGRINISVTHHITTQLEWASRVQWMNRLGWDIGARCVSRIDCRLPSDQGWLKIGDRGTIIGPCNSPGLGIVSESLCVDFGEGKRRVIARANDLEKLTNWERDKLLVEAKKAKTRAAEEARHDQILQEAKARQRAERAEEEVAKVRQRAERKQSAKAASSKVPGGSKRAEAVHAEHLSDSSDHVRATPPSVPLDAAASVMQPSPLPEGKNVATLSAAELGPALYRAAWEGDSRQLKEMMKRLDTMGEKNRAKLHRWATEDGSTPLHVAVLRGFVAASKLLADHQFAWPDGCSKAPLERLLHSKEPPSASSASSVLSTSSSSSSPPGDEWSEFYMPSSGDQQVTHQFKQVKPQFKHRKFEPTLGALSEGVLEEEEGEGEEEGKDEDAAGRGKADEADEASGLDALPAQSLAELMNAAERAATSHELRDALAALGAAPRPAHGSADWHAQAMALADGEVRLSELRWSEVRSLSDLHCETPHDLLPRSFSAHTILVVDCSGSMRKQDVHTGTEEGDITRHQAVQRLLLDHFLRMQVDAGAPAHERVSLIRMQGAQQKEADMWRMTPFALFPFDVSLARRIQSAIAEPISHGPYLPTLELLTKLVRLSAPFMQERSKTSILILSDGKPSDSCDACELPSLLEAKLKGLHEAVGASATFLEQLSLLGFGDADERMLQMMASSYPGNVASAQLVGSGSDGFRALQQSVSTFASSVSVSRLSSVSAVDTRNRTLRRIPDRSIGLLRERMHTYEGCEIYLHPETLGDFNTELEVLRGRHTLQISSRMLGHGGERNAYLMRFVTPTGFTTPDEEWVIKERRWNKKGEESNFSLIERNDEEFHRKALVTQHAAAELAERFNADASDLGIVGLPKVSYMNHCCAHTGGPNPPLRACPAPPPPVPRDALSPRLLTLDPHRRPLPPAPPSPRGSHQDGARGEAPWRGADG